MTKYYLIFLLLVSTVTSCTLPVQLYELKSAKAEMISDTLSYQVDSVLFQYSFWENGGEMTVTISNMGSKPVYIDWGRTSLIHGETSTKFWTDVTFINGKVDLEVYDNPLQRDNIENTVVGKFKAGEVSVPRYSFIEPQTTISRSVPLDVEAYLMDIEENGAVQIEKNNSYPKRKVKVYSEFFTAQESPYKIRNFLCFDFAEDFSNPQYIDIDFYVQRIQQMPRNHFELYQPKNRIKYQYFFERSNNFYLRP